jgi:predicted permease
VKIQAAQANIDVIANRIRDRDKRDRTFGISAVTLRDQAVGQMRQSIWVMFGAVGFLLLIVCANVTNLLLSRAAARQKEVALRTALGASKWRIVRQSLTESGLLALLGAVVGLVLASFGLSVLSKLDVGLLPRVGSIGLDARVVLFTLLLSVFSGVIFSMAPALRVFSPDLVSALRAGGRTLHGGGGFKAVRNQVRSALVVSEVALALAVVISAGLLIRSFVRLLSVPPGFTPDHVVSMQISLTDAKYKKPETKIGFYENAARRIRQTPGVLAQGAVSALPFSSGVSWGSIAVEGYVPPARQTDVQVDQRIVTPGFFETLKIPLRRGRLIAEQDLATALPIAVVDERMARRFWPGQDPVGKRVRLTDERRWMTVVGVVGTVKQYGLDAEERATLYMPYQQKPVTTMYIVARTATGGASMSLQIAQVIQSVDPSEPVYDISPMQTRIDNSLLRQRMSMAMLVFFACAALVLAAIGVYGVLSYVVAQGGRDIGIRMMLGAQPANVLLLVLRYGMGITSLGLLLGIGASFALGSVMQSLLFGIKATDTVTFLVSIPVLAIVALLATYVPARRALRVDPMETFRSE